MSLERNSIHKPFFNPKLLSFQLAFIPLYRSLFPRKINKRNKLIFHAIIKLSVINGYHRSIIDRRTSFTARRWLPSRNKTTSRVVYASLTAGCEMNLLISGDGVFGTRGRFLQRCIHRRAPSERRTVSMHMKLMFVREI